MQSTATGSSGMWRTEGGSRSFTQTGVKADNTKVGDYLGITAAWWPEIGTALLAGPVGAHPGPVWAMAQLGQRAGLP